MFTSQYKTFFCFLFSLCFSLFSFSQPYQTLFGSQSTSWNIYYEIPDAGFTDSLVSGHDTIINSQTYKTIAKEGLYLYGFLREDTIQGKGWFMNKSDNVEYLVMDLNLSVNDSFVFGKYYWESTKKVDSVYYENGKKHIRFILDSDFPSVYDTAYPSPVSVEFIEGIGPNIGFTYQGDNNDQSFAFALLCANKDGQSTYQKFSYCRYGWVGIAEKNNSEKSISVQPNPNNGEFTLVLPVSGSAEFTEVNQQPATLKIYNILGEIVYTRIIRVRQSEIKMYNLPSGIYFYKITNSISVGEESNEVLSTGKIIIHL